MDHATSEAATQAGSEDAGRNSRQTMNPEGETFMTKLKKPAGAYLIGTAVIVAAFFITNPLLAGLLDPVKVWAVLDILMLIGLLDAQADHVRPLGGGVMNGLRELNALPLQLTLPL